MSPQHTTLSWHHDATGHLRLRVADPTQAGLRRAFDVPTDIRTEIHDLINSHELIGSRGAGSRTDPASDLIRLESALRLRAARLEEVTTQLRQRVDHTRAALDTARGLNGQRGLAKLRDRRQLAAQLGDAVDELTAAEARDEARDRVRAVREFVIALDIPDGLLAQARVGWQRDPARPAFVSMFASEAIFATADMRRALPTIGWNTPGVAGEQFGVGWRRDGDDDDPHTDEPAVIGPWQLGYLPATGEVYATRRCHYLDEQVWLLGAGFTDPEVARGLLAGLKQGHMREPNSLIHAAHSIHDTAAHRSVVDHGQAHAQDRAQDRAGGPPPPRGTGSVAAEQSGRG